VAAELPIAEALANAPLRASSGEVRASEEFFVFRVGEFMLGVTSTLVREVTRASSVTPIPRAPSFVLGVCGNRGEVFPLIDLLRFLSIGESRPSAKTRVFLCQGGGVTVGFLADQLYGLRKIFLADKLPPPASLGNVHEFVQAVVRSSEFGTLVLLWLPKVIESARQKAVSR
jgi:purine-binding chemotaxis protein CheW